MKKVFIVLMTGLLLTSCNTQTNSDGSVDLYFGPAAPASGESNWVPTDPNGKFEVLARFYGPKPGLYNNSWKMGDIEKVK